MYLKKLRLQNIKCFEDVTLEFPHRDGDYSGWNVILGENGQGKTTIIRGITELVIELHESGWLYDDEWVSGRAESGLIEATFAATRFDDPSLRGGRAERTPPFNQPKRLTLKSHVDHLAATFDPRSLKVIKSNTPGWLACGYGPFRRLDNKPFPFPIRPGQAPFLTVLSDGAGISEPFAWLRSMYGRSLDPKVRESERLRREFPTLLAVLNGLLPGSIRITDVSTEGVRFETGAGAQLDALNLSDGYRSFLALATDLLMRTYLATDRFSQYLKVTESDPPQVLAEGIVLIDEADAHLHPRWQRELGERLCRVFPKIQFIVTTHSPFIAQEATDGGLFVLRPTEKGTVTVEQPVPSVRGWTASQILTSPLFGLESTRSPDTEARIRESATLTAKEQRGKLTAGEKKRLATIRKDLKETLSAPGETYDEMNRQQRMADYVDETLKHLKNGNP